MPPDASSIWPPLCTVVSMAEPITPAYPRTTSNPPLETVVLIVLPAVVLIVAVPS
jgi:hypothetical protein